MKTINAIRYTGSNHTTIIADKKNNPELRTSVQYTALSSEEAETQLKDLLSTLTEEPTELVINDVDPKKFSKLTTAQLLKAYEKTTQMLGAREMMESILIKRGALTVADDEDENPIEGEDKPKREYKKCMTEECLQERLAQARTNYKKFCKFLCTKDKEEHYGIIRSARLDKRSGFIQYRIEIIDGDPEVGFTRSGRIYGKGDDSKDLTIYTDETKPTNLVLTTPTEENNSQDAE